jgi:hypothetical protein
MQEVREEEQRTAVLANQSSLTRSDDTVCAVFTNITRGKKMRILSHFNFKNTVSATQNKKVSNSL